MLDNVAPICLLSNCFESWSKEMGSILLKMANAKVKCWYIYIFFQILKSSFPNSAKFPNFNLFCHRDQVLKVLTFVITVVDVFPLWTFLFPNTLSMVHPVVSFAFTFWIFFPVVPLLFLFYGCLLMIVFLI